MKSMLDMLIPNSGNPMASMRGGSMTGKTGSPQQASFGSSPMGGETMPWDASNPALGTLISGSGTLYQQRIDNIKYQIDSMNNDIIRLMEKSRGGRVPAVNDEITRIRARISLLTQKMSELEAQKAQADSEFQANRELQRMGPYSRRGVAPPRMGTQSMSGRFGR